jgi:hypothetical protein
MRLARPHVATMTSALSYGGEVRNPMNEDEA